MRTHLNFIFLAIIAGSISCLLASCNKTDIRPDCGSSICQIATFEGDIDGWAKHESDTFTYNKAGNPILRSRSNVSTGTENESYRYDAKQRLTDLIRHYKDASYGAPFLIWHRFKYRNNEDRPYLDSVLNNGGTIGDDPIPLENVPQVVTLTYFTYDAKGRLIEETTFYDDGSIWYNKKYLYNSANNLEKVAFKPGLSPSVDTIYYGPYDNKINFLRTNKVWQLLNRDYSVNNEQPAVTYNKYGLPLQFPDDPKGKRVNFLDAYMINMKITYKCK